MAVKQLVKTRQTAETFGITGKRLFFTSKMVFKDLFVVAVATVLCFSQCSAQTCSGQYTSKVVNNRCELECGAQQCLCSNESSSSNNKTFNACLQRCDRSPRGSNDTVTNCMDMKCSDLDTCFQTCNTDSCSMECKAKTRCNQECGLRCTKMLCSASECRQQCINCTMECTNETKTCNHYCLGGVCYSKCFAESCIQTCRVGVDCKILNITAMVGTTTSSTPIPPTTGNTGHHLTSLEFLYLTLVCALSMLLH